MAADEVDALAAPSGECAVADDEAVEAGTFDAVMIPARPDVADVDVFEGGVLDQIFKIAAIVEVKAVGRLSAEAEMSERETGTA